jgi:uncharacterized membrane protein YgcG
VLSIRNVILATFFAALALLAGCAAPGHLLVVDEGGRLDRAQVEAAAAPLVARGAAVAVFVVERGDERGEDFARRLDAAGLLRDGRIAPEGIGVYVSFAPRYSELRAGGRWSDALPDESLRAIRLEALNPELRADRFTAGVERSLAAIDSALPPRWADLPRWLLALALLALPLGYLVLPPLLRRTWWGLRESPPGHAAARLWDLSPPGRAAARRRLEQRVAAQRARVERAAQHAQDDVGLRPEGSSARTALDMRLARLNQRRADLDGRDADDALVKDMLQLVTHYDDLRVLAQAHRYLEQQVARARRRVMLARAGCKRGQERSRTARKRGRPAIPPPSPELCVRLAEVEERLERTDRQRAGMDERLADAADPARELDLLRRDYVAIENAAFQIWKVVSPYDYQRETAGHSAAWTTGAADTSSAYTSGSSDTSGGSSPSDWSSGSSNSGGGGESSDGGSW